MAEALCRLDKMANNEVAEDVKTNHEHPQQEEMVEYVVLEEGTTQEAEHIVVDEVVQEEFLDQILEVTAAATQSGVEQQDDDGTVIGDCENTQVINIQIKVADMTDQTVYTDTDGQYVQYVQHGAQPTEVQELAGTEQEVSTSQNVVVLPEESVNLHQSSAHPYGMGEICFVGEDVQCVLEEATVEEVTTLVTAADAAEIQHEQKEMVSLLTNTPRVSSAQEAQSAAEEQTEYTCEQGADNVTYLVGKDSQGKPIKIPLPSEHEGGSGKSTYIILNEDEAKALANGELPATDENGTAVTYIVLKGKSNRRDGSGAQFARVKIQRQETKGNNAHTCSVCSKSFAKLKYLKAHFITHSEARPFPCQVCELQFKKRAGLLRHMRLHTGNRPHACDQCNKTFTNSGHLVEHLRTHTGEKRHTCSFCGKTFRRASDMKRHENIHTGERMYVCVICNKEFTSQDVLRVHMRVHTGETPYSCIECPKAFSSAGNLQKHMLTHTNERRHVCDVCSTSFAQKDHLNTHMRIHTNSKPFLCTACGKRFRTKGNLTTHSVIHTGARPYVCSSCGKGFTQSNGLNAHLNRHAKDLQTVGTNSCKLEGVTDAGVRLRVSKPKRVSP